MTKLTTLTTPVPAQFILTLNKSGFIQGICEAWPPQELKPNQLTLTQEEFSFLSKINPMTLIKARSLIRSIENKIKRSKR